MGIDAHGYTVNPAKPYDAHRHRRYRLACGQYDELLARCGRKCEMCGKPDIDQPWQRLCIDHDHRYGLWAVRGMLCGWCNRRLEKMPLDTPGLADYLGNAWFLGLDVRLDPPPEPAVGWQALAPGRRLYLRTDDGWVRPYTLPHNPPDDRLVSWRWIHYQYGAHNVRLRAPAADTR